MKTIKILSLIFLFVTMWSCSDDEEIIPLTEPTFTITVSPENSGIYYFENTTPNKEEFYNYWEFELGGTKVADENGVVEFEYKESGSKTVTLTMVSSITNMQSFESITVTLPIIPDDGYPTNPENLLLNGYLAEGDDDDFTNWGKYNGEDRITATDDALIGSRAIKVSNDAAGNAWDAQFVSDAVATTVDDEYTISFWGKGTGTVRFSTQPNAKYGPDFILTSDWVQYSWTMNANESMTQVALDMGAAMGTFFIDVIEIVPGGSALSLPSNDSLTLNGGLEEGEGDDFTNWEQLNGADRITEETTDFLSGSRAMKVSNDAAGNAWDAQVASDAATTEVGATYVASFWGKGTGTVRFSTQPNAKYGPDYVLTSEWTKYSFEFDANEPETRVVLDMGAAMGTFIIDNIKLEKK